MTAEEVIRLIQTMEPPEIERLFVMIREYEAAVRRRQAAVHRGGDENEFKRIADRVSSENKELFQKLAEFERKERETISSS